MTKARPLLHPELLNRRERSFFQETSLPCNVCRAETKAWKHMAGQSKHFMLNAAPFSFVHNINQHSRRAQGKRGSQQASSWAACCRPQYMINWYMEKTSHIAQRQRIQASFHNLVLNNPIATAAIHLHLYLSLMSSLLSLSHRLKINSSQLLSLLVSPKKNPSIQWDSFPSSLPYFLIYRILRPALYPTVTCRAAQTPNLGCQVLKTH